MHITRIDADLLTLPQPLPRSLPRADDPDAGQPAHNELAVLLVHVDTDEGLRGCGFAYARQGARVLRATVGEGIAPRIVGADPCHHERVVRLMPRDTAPAARAAIDLAIWDLKAKAAGVPLWNLLGGARDSAPVYCAETAWPWMSGEQVVDAYESLKDLGVKGLHVGIGNRNPEADARKLEFIRDRVGLDDWLGVTAGGAYDAATGLAMGRFLEEEMDADWFENPVAAYNSAGLLRLADKLEIPVAAGSEFDRLADFSQWVTQAPAGVVRPDIQQLGGLTTALKVIALAEALHKPVVPVLMPEVAMHLACGLSAVMAVDYVAWLTPLWMEPLKIVEGRLVPSNLPGLGIEPNPDAVARFRDKS